MGYAYLVTALTLNAVANISLKVGSKNLHYFKEVGMIEAVMKNYVLILGLILFALNVIFYSVALSKLPLSLAYPLMVGGGFLIITLFSTFYLKETLSGVQLSGILLLLSGIILISLPKS
ncbi:MAG: hypothetical protein HYV32_00840 [Candidatus Kerfeldbacteria bacterium]|nr:hypothetical protein [Candidatus Kerfeldbacteria bacterium]